MSQNIDMTLGRHINLLFALGLSLVPKVGILAVFWSFLGSEDYILFQENILPVFRSLSNPKSLALRALDFVHSSTPNHSSANPRFLKGKPMA